MPRELGFMSWPRSSASDWCCQNVGSNPGLAGCGACVLEQDV